MYDLNLTAEQREIRDTVRDFVQREVRPVATHPDRLQQPDQPLPGAILDAASRMGLRSLCLSEAAGGAGADALTLCVVAEELAAGDVGVASLFMQTSVLSHALFDGAMTAEQRTRFLPRFLADGGYHLAYARDDGGNDLGWSYHRPLRADAACGVTAVRQNDGGWVLNGVYAGVAHAPAAKLFAIRAATGGGMPDSATAQIFLATPDTPGLAVRVLNDADSGPEGEPVYRWHHGTAGAVELQDCRLPAANVLGGAEIALDGSPHVQALNLGVGRAAYEAAVEYAKLRVQGGKRIIEHQSIAILLADIAIRLDMARHAVWRAAWAADHPDGRSDAGPGTLPLQAVAQVYTSEAVHQATLDAAEVFGAMGVMRDMPMQKYARDAMIFLHAQTGNTAARLRIAEHVAGYERPRGAA